MTSLPKIYDLSRYARVKTILVVGCGGTGAYVVSHLTRLISSLDAEERPQLFLADGDIVEKKNLARQHFILTDIAKNKASALAERYSAAFGIEIFAITKDLEKTKDFHFLNDTRMRSDQSYLIISCVDNNASRQAISKWIRSQSSAYFWIDSGNEENSGQVVCGYFPSSSGTYGAVKISPSENKNHTAGEFSLPSVVEVYPELLNDDKFNSELSCAERAVSAPQNMQANVTAATLVLNYAQKTILGLPIASFGVEFNIDNVFATKFNTTKNLSIVNQERARYWEKKK